MDKLISAANATSFDNVFVGREEQIELINNEYGKLMNGDLGFVTIAGAPGVGKTYLAKHALKHACNDSYFYGKYRENDKRTLVAISDILEQITSTILTLPKKTLYEIKDELNKNIGEDMVLLSTICPDLKNVFGIKKSVNIEDFNKLKYRMKNAIYYFVLIISKYLFPLVIYIDDLQWADQLSIDILRTFINKKGIINVFVIISLRTKELEERSEKILSTLKENSSFIYLENLNSKNIDSYINQVFGSDLNQKEHLVKLVNGLTSGNPFYIKEILQNLLEEKVMHYSSQSRIWKLSTGGINNFDLPDNIELLLKNRIKDQHLSNSYLLELISCLDGYTDYNVLKSIYKIDEEMLNKYINKLVDSAVLIKQINANKLELHFSHDIISKHIDSSIPDNKRKQIHLDIAKTIWMDKNIAIQNKDAFVVSHLIRCSVEDVGQNAENWIGLLFKVGNEEKKKASIEIALVIFEFAEKLFKYIQVIDRLFYVKLHLELAECLFLYNRTDQCQKIMDSLAKDYRETEEKIAIKRKQLYLYQYKRDHKMVLKTGSEILRQLRFKFGIHRLPIDLLRSMYVYNPSKIDRIVEAPKVTDDKLLLIIQVLTLMNVSAALTNDKLTAPIGLSAALVAAKRGSSGDSLIGYSSYCYVEYLILKDYKNAEPIFIEALEQE